MSQRKWTEAQHNAVYADSGTLLVSAAAGSGKTSVLVERIVRKLTQEENPVAPSQLLVVTFTNAAAAEMRSRINKRIFEKMNEEPNGRHEYFALLSRLDEMQVCTMDAFCLKLVKENSHRLGIEADFRILDTAEEDRLKKQICVLVSEKRFEENYETFEPLTRMFEAGRNDKAFIDTVISLANFAVSEPDPERWLRDINANFTHGDIEKSVWGKCIREEALFSLHYCLELSDAANADIGEDEELEAKLAEIFTFDRQQLDYAYEKVESGAWDEKKEAIQKAFLNIKGKRFPTIKGYALNPSKLAAQKKRDKYKKVLEKTLELFCCTKEENRDDIDALSGIVTELTDTVLEYNRRLLEEKKEMSAYSFSDISHFALSLLYAPENKDGKTELARELTESFSEILIDEYQDTNRAQDMLFSCLSRDGNNMFLVGDVKQSIYRFRLASPEIFMEKCNTFPYYDGKAERSKIILSENFRSRKGILDGVNFVFSSLMSPECGEMEYNEDERLNYPASFPQSEDVNLFCTFAEAGSFPEAEIEARIIAKEIKEKIEKTNAESPSENEKIKPSDFCVLLRSKGTSLSALVKELKAVGLPVSSEAAEAFFERSEIKMVMSYLNVIDNPLRDTCLLAVLLSPIFGFSPDEAARLRIKYGRKKSLYSCVCLAAEDGDEKCRNVSSKLSYFKKLSSGNPTDILLREIYADTALLYTVGAMPDGKARKANLITLLEMAEKSSEYRTSLGSFLRYTEEIRENSSTVSASSGTDGVRIMTMHKSKGLEFPFVYIAGASKKFNKNDIRSNLIANHNYGVGIKRREAQELKCYDTLSSTAVKLDTERANMSEELRIYYVAMTRAKRELHIVCASEKMREKLEEKEYLLSNMKNIPAYAVRNASTPSEWLMMCFLRHPDAQSIRFVTPNRTVPENKAVFEYIDSPIERTAVEVENEEVQPDTELVAKIGENVSFKYKWEEISNVLSKHTASSLNEEHFDPVGFGKSVPGFMFAKKLSPTDIGTATHRFLQFCDFNACKKDIVGEIDRLEQKGRISQKQAECVDVSAIKAFFDSEEFRRIENAQNVYREKQFTLSKSICELDVTLPQDYKDEKTVIIGKTDLIFIEYGQAVIVDYKTDNIKDINVLADRYKMQMRIYIEAVQKSMGVKVKECILYSLTLKEAISLKSEGIFENT